MNRDLELLRLMSLARVFDEMALSLRLSGEIDGPMHPYTGEEGIAAGVCAALAPGDRITSHHRGHGHTLGKGADPRRMFAELFGARTGYCGGKGGSMHIANAEIGMLGANGIVGAGASIACGSGLATRLRGEADVTACFFGDGATGQGQVYEAMNLAVIWQLPLLFVCENNGWAVDTPADNALGAESVAALGAVVGLHSQLVDGNDVEAVYEAAIAGLAHARATGPALIEARTYRMGVHAQRGVTLTDKRPADVRSEWSERDPIQRYELRLRARGVADAEIDAVHDAVKTELAAALQVARRDPMPDLEAIFADVLSKGNVSPELPAPPAREATTLQAIELAIAEALRTDDATIFLSTEIPASLKEFGPERVRQCPISEAAFTGAAVGAAMCGIRPIVWLRNATFSFVAFDQLVNQAAKLRYMSGGQYSVPITVWMNGGGGVRSAAQHSQAPWSVYGHIPGLRVVAPSGPSEAYGMTLAAIRHDDPTIVFGAYRLNAVREELQPAYGALDTARVARPGNDVTVVAVSGMVRYALEAAERAAEQGVSTEIIDVRSIAPLDADVLRASVVRTGRLISVDEASSAYSLGSEVAAVIAEDGEALSALRAPMIRVATAPVPVPYSPHLEDAVFPTPDTIHAAIMSTIRVEAVPAR